MSKGIGVVGLYVHDQDEALDFYVNKLGFAVHADARNGAYRWLTVKHPNQPTMELGLFQPQEPVMDAATAQTMREMVAKGAMPPLVLVVEDCKASYEAMRAKGCNVVERFNTEQIGKGYALTYLLDHMIDTGVAENYDAYFGPLERPRSWNKLYKDGGLQFPLAWR